MMEPFTKVEVNLPVSETAQPGRDADLPLVQQEEPYQRSQRSRKRSADALLVTGYLAAVLLICLTLKGSLAQKKFRLVKDAPKAVVSDFPPASDPAESSTEEAVDQGAAEDSGESYDFPRIDDLKARRKLSEVLGFLKQPVHNAIQSEMRTFRIPIKGVDVILRIGKKTDGKQYSGEKLPRHLARNIEMMVVKVAEWAKNSSASNNAQERILMQDIASYESCKVSLIATAARPHGD